MDGAEVHSVHEAVDLHAEELRQEAKDLKAKLSKAAASEGPRGVWGMLVEELGLPSLKFETPSLPTRELVGDVLAPVKEIIGTPEKTSSAHTEKLNAEEKKGLYVLLGIFVGGVTLSKVVA